MGWKVIRGATGTFTHQVQILIVLVLIARPNTVHILNLCVASCSLGKHTPPNAHVSAPMDEKGSCGASQTPPMGPTPQVLPDYTSPTTSHTRIAPAFKEQKYAAKGAYSHWSAVIVVLGAYSRHFVATTFVLVEVWAHTNLGLATICYFNCQKSGRPLKHFTKERTQRNAMQRNTTQHPNEECPSFLNSTAR